MPELPKNTFFDINKLPKEYGILVFPISINKAEHANGQDSLQCMNYIKHFSPSKVTAPKIGLNMIYGDFLYFHSKESAAKLKNKFMGVALNHRRAFQKLLQKEWDRFQIQQAFSYEVWNQLYVDYDGDFASDFSKIRNLYKKDKKLQKYLKDDAGFYNKKITEEQIDFFLRRTSHALSFI